MNDIEVIRYFGLAMLTVLLGCIIGAAVIQYRLDRADKNARGIERHGR